MQLVVTRSPSFVGDVSFGVTGVAPAVAVSTIPPVTGGSNATSFTITIDAKTSKGEYPLTITGTSGALSAQVTVTLHVGSLITPDDAGLLEPSHPILVKAWGAGGGAGGVGVPATGGGGGGGGGFYGGGGGGFSSTTAGAGGGGGSGYVIAAAQNPTLTTAFSIAASNMFDPDCSNCGSAGDTNPPASGGRGRVVVRYAK